MYRIFLRACNKCIQDNWLVIIVDKRKEMKSMQRDQNMYFLIIQNNETSREDYSFSGRSFLNYGYKVHLTTRYV